MDAPTIRNAFPYQPGELTVTPASCGAGQSLYARGRYVGSIFAADAPVLAFAVADYARLVAENERLRAALERLNAMPLVVTVGPTPKEV